MKRTFQFLALVAICSATMVSCKNTKQSEPTPEEIQAQKVALADSVLAQIDAFAEDYINVSDDADIFFIINLSDEEKMVKPDYLLEPSEASKFVNKEQKINALAIYVMEYYVRLLYDMPTEDVKEVIAKLAVELNHPIDGDFLTSDKLASEFIREEYNGYKERGELSYFWQFENAILRETDYLLAKNPELFLSKLSEENIVAYNEQFNTFMRALWVLAPYDEEINQIAQIFTVKSEEDLTKVYNDFSSIGNYIKTYKSNSYNFIERRNALLQ